ncbi:MAG: hypothetical protein FWG23_05430 [Eggerthellaceae bacterium]|nr:hypothetical protein [Eggerthellaceae bacterium]
MSKTETTKQSIGEGAAARPEPGPKHRAAPKNNLLEALKAASQTESHDRQPGHAGHAAPSAAAPAPAAQAAPAVLAAVAPAAPVAASAPAPAAPPVPAAAPAAASRSRTAVLAAAVVVVCALAVTGALASGSPGSSSKPAAAEAEADAAAADTAAVPDTAPAPAPAPPTDPLELIRSQLPNNHGSAIADLGYDSALTFEAYASNITSVNAAALQPLTVENNQGPGYSIDEAAVGRIIALNADWAAYLTNTSAGTTAVFDHVAPAAPADTAPPLAVPGTSGPEAPAAPRTAPAAHFIQAYKDSGYRIAFHRLAIGEIRIDGSRVYVLTQPYYTVVHKGTATAVNDVFLYQLATRGETLVVSSIEQVAPLAEAQPEQPPPTQAR